ncbi:hypothetical protein OAX78_01670 [Planctomycetota bacterium]|nr:hypothetical protein [Planctomycetota bacterium]
MKRLLTSALSLSASLLLASGCNPPPRGDRPPLRAQPAAGELREPTEAELRELVRLSEAVVVGRVEERLEEPEGVFYTVRITEILHVSPSAEDSWVTHPLEAEKRVRVSQFLWRRGRQGSAVGALGDLTRYVFFASPAESPNTWLNLDDASGYPLPEAQPTVETLRGWRDEGLTPEEGE